MIMIIFFFTDRNLLFCWVNVLRFVDHLSLKELQMIKMITTKYKFYCFNNFRENNNEHKVIKTIEFRRRERLTPVAAAMNPLSALLELQ